MIGVPNFDPNQIPYIPSDSNRLTRQGHHEISTKKTESQRPDQQSFLSDSPGEDGSRAHE